MSLNIGSTEKKNTGMQTYADFRDKQIVGSLPSNILPKQPYKPAVLRWASKMSRYPPDYS